VYDLSAFMLEITPVKTPFSHFLARLCAIAGGAFTVMGLLDSAFGHARKAFGGKAAAAGGGGGGGGGGGVGSGQKGKGGL
jgi:hypothetical protein